jgi:hypothetical protein
MRMWQTVVSGPCRGRGIGAAPPGEYADTPPENLVKHHIHPILKRATEARPGNKGISDVNVTYVTRRDGSVLRWAGRQRFWLWQGSGEVWLATGPGNDVASTSSGKRSWLGKYAGRFA